MEQNMIEINELSKKYRIGDQDFLALDSACLSIKEGEIVAILGPSGSGKSTLLNILGGIDHASSGSLSFDGIQISSLSDVQLTDYRRKNIGFVFQFYNLIANLTVYENVEVVADISRNPLDIKKLLTDLGIYEIAGKYPVELSGGQQQRVAIARAFVKNPRLLLCDEPTGALDYKSSIEILRLVKELNDTYHTTIIIITHNSAISGMCHRVVRLRSGKITHNEINEEIIPVERIAW